MPLIFCLAQSIVKIQSGETPLTQMMPASQAIHSPQAMTLTLILPFLSYQGLCYMLYLIIKPRACRTMSF